MPKFFIVIFFCLAFCALGQAQTQIEWLSWEEALQRNQIEKKKILVDVYTQWCTWCKKMDARTYKKDHIAKMVNENFYAVRFDAGEKKDIIFNNKIYSYVSGFGKKGYHELAKEIMNGRMSYPTTVFIDEELNVIQPIPGFQGASTMKMIMAYFAGNHYMNVPWHKFEKDFKQYNNPGTPLSIQPAVQPVKNH